MIGALARIPFPEVPVPGRFSLADSLASFFRLGEGEAAAGAPAEKPARAATTSNDAALQALADDVAALRHQVAAPVERLTGPPDLTSEEPAPGEDSAAIP